MFRTVKQRVFKCRHNESGLLLNIYEMATITQFDRDFGPPDERCTAIEYVTDAGSYAHPTSQEQKRFSVYADRLCEVDVLEVNNINETVTIASRESGVLMGRTLVEVDTVPATSMNGITSFFGKITQEVANNVLNPVVKENGFE